MTKEEYLDGRCKKTIESLMSMEIALAEQKSKRKVSVLSGYIEQLKINLEDMQNGSFWNPLREYYFNVMYKDVEFDYDRISIV